jgi:hypothetical protein
MFLHCNELTNRKPQSIFFFQLIPVDMHLIASLQFFAILLLLFTVLLYLRISNDGSCEELLEYKKTRGFLEQLSSYYRRNHWISELCPSFAILNNYKLQRFGNLRFT